MQSTTGPIENFRFSSDDLPPRERLKAMRELQERGILPLEPLPACPVHVQIAKLFLPGVGILSGKLCGLKQTGARDAVDERDDIFLGVNLAGISTATQRGREVVLRDGDAVLLSCAGDGFTISRPTPVHFVGFRVPRQALASTVPDLEDPPIRLISGKSAPLRLLTSYIGAIGSDGPTLEPRELRLAVVTHIHDLIALSIGARRDATVAAEERGVRAARLRAVKTDIAANLDDCGLTVTAIAARHRVTPRYIQKLFESEGLTFSQFVLGQRLAQAHRLLVDPRFSKRAISSIAFDVGFGDLSHFNGSFRRHYQLTPSEVRHRAAG